LVAVTILGSRAFRRTQPKRILPHLVGGRGAGTSLQVKIHFDNQIT